MNQKRLGRTGLLVSEVSFGALPIQRVAMDEAVKILRAAYDGGITYFDTARGYSDSEEKLGRALSDVRGSVVISSKTKASSKEAILLDIETGLKKLQTDYIDIYQLHNPAKVDTEDPNGPYAGLVEAKKRGWIRFIGITNHRVRLASDAARSGLYDTVQFPFSYISAPIDLELVKLCAELDIGFIAMKAMAGGLIKSPKAAYAFMKQHENVVPIWGIQSQKELSDFLSYARDNVSMTDDLQKNIDADNAELPASFCHACGYCLPCPAGINIPTDARISLLLRRSVYQRYLNDAFAEEMARIENCQNCGHCLKNCPYLLDTPALLRANLEHYREFCVQHKDEWQK